MATADLAHCSVRPRKQTSRKRCCLRGGEGGGAEGDGMSRLRLSPTRGIGDGGDSPTPRRPGMSRMELALIFLSCFVVSSAVLALVLSVLRGESRKVYGEGEKEKKGMEESETEHKGKGGGEHSTQDMGSAVTVRDSSHCLAGKAHHNQKTKCNQGVSPTYTNIPAGPSAYICKHNLINSIHCNILLYCAYQVALVIPCRLGRT